MKKIQNILSGRFTFFKILMLYIKYIFTKPDIRIKKLKDKHKGKRCFIIGLGPSLDILDLDELWKNKEICFSVNRIYHVYDKTEWRPDYFFISDKRGDDEEMVNAIAKMEARGVVAICESGVKLSPEVNPIRYRGRYFCTPLDNSKFSLARRMKKPCRYSTNPEKFIYDGASCIHSIIQLAGYMGFAEVYLLGCDCDSIDGKDYNEHIKIKTDGAKYAKEGDAVISDYQGIKDDMNKKNIAMKIYNATRGGRLEVFQRVCFDELFK